MKILDYFEHPQFGVIVSTVNPEFDNLPDEEIKKRIGNEISILDADDCKKKSVKVKSIDIATSLIGKKNINICLSDSIKLSDINPGASLLLEVHEEDKNSRILTRSQEKFAHLTKDLKLG